MSTVRFCIIVADLLVAFGEDLAPENKPKGEILQSSPVTLPHDDTSVKN